MEAPDTKYYQVVIDTQTQAHILESEFQDLVTETKFYIAWAEERLNQEVTNVCSCKGGSTITNYWKICCSRCQKVIPREQR